MSNNRSGAFFGGLFLGAAIGTITGLLIAPRPGRETRQLLKKSADALPELAEDLSTSVQLQADRLSESALRSWDGTLARLREAISAGIEATQREQELEKRIELRNVTEPHLMREPSQEEEGLYSRGTRLGTNAAGEFSSDS